MDDQVAGVEAQFHARDDRQGSRASEKLCRECNTQPAWNPGCQDCAGADGCCVLCPGCRSRHTTSLVTGIVDLGLQNESRMILTVLRDLSRCDLVFLIGAMGATILGTRKWIEHQGGVSVEDWLSRVREDGQPMA